MTGHGEKLSRKREAAIIALLAEPNLEKAAARVGVSVRTLKNWKKREDFAAAFQAAKSETYGQALTAIGYQIVLGGPEGMLKLRERARSENEHVSVSAAKALVELYLKFQDTVDLENRLVALEHKQRLTTTPKRTLPLISYESRNAD